MTGIDYEALRRAISIEQVLNLLEFAPSERHGEQLRGPCPIHPTASTESRSFSVNLTKNAFRCFVCGQSGNQLDLWSKMCALPLYDASLKLCEQSNVPVPRLKLESEKRNP
jgi:DNA primase